MFTGLVQGMGSIVAVQPLAGGVHIEIDASALAPRRIHIGDSIAVNGVCLTATSIQGMRFGADVSAETLSRTCGLDTPGAVNLETSLALGDTLGGHLVSGHVDGVGEVLRCTPVGESIEFVVQASALLAPFLAIKGSVAVDGVSLTINQVKDRGGPNPGCEISINLIPHTLAVTTLGNRGPGTRVNMEVDMIARYVERMIQGRFLQY